MKERLLSANETLELILEIYEQDTAHLSYDKTDHPVYKNIVAFGEKAIPFLLSKLGKSRLPLRALSEITGVHPQIKKEDYGKYQVNCQWWMAWGKEKGYLK